MNTPSKEALDAAENVQDYWGFPRRATIDLATIIDRHFEPLRQRAEQAETRVKELEAERDAAYREASRLARSMFSQHYAQMEEYASGRVKWGLCDSISGIVSQIDNMHAGVAGNISALRAANAAQYARGHDDARAEYSKQIEGLRAELADWVSATNAQRDRAEKAQAANAELAGALLDIGGSPERDKDFSIGETKLRLRARFALAHLAAGEPVQEACGGRCGDPHCNLSTEGELMREPAKHPDTEGSK